MHKLQNPNEINKPQFLRLVADYSGYKVKDVNAIYNAIIKVFELCISNKIGMYLSKIGRLKYTIWHEHDGWNYIKREPMHIPEVTQVSFLLVPTLRNLVKKKKE
jgi:nucleoid DNA-binding protein